MNIKWRGLGYSGIDFVPCGLVRDLFFLLFVAMSFSVQAQKEEADFGTDQLALNEVKSNNVKLFNETINEAIKVHTAHDFTLYKEQRIPMRDKVGNIINIQMDGGQWYHFVFIGDPSTKKLKVTLFKEGIGDFVTNRIDKEGEFATEFSFIAPVTGIYEFTCFQKGEMESPLAYLMLFKKNAPVAKVQ
jgi:hypothetical protein